MPKNDDRITRVTDVSYSGNITEAIESKQLVRADQLSGEYVGRFIGNSDEALGVNYLIKILSIERVESGPAPGVTLHIRHGGLPTRPSYDDSWHVPFDQVFEIIDLVG